MEPVPFRFLSDDEFLALSQEDKAGYLNTAVEELAKMTGMLSGYADAARSQPDSSKFRTQSVPSYLTRKTSLPRK